MSSKSDSWFFPLSGIAFLAIAIAGFGQSFVIPISQGHLEFSPSVIFHALVMFGWLFVYLIQSLLSSRGKIIWHRNLGYGACVLYILVWISSVSISISSFLSPLPEPVRTLISNIFFLQIVSWFIGPAFFVLAIRTRKTGPSNHKRYMYLLTFFLLEAAFSRMRWLPGMSNEDYWILIQYLYCDLFLLILVVYDFKTHNSLAQATKVGLGLFLPYQVIAVLVWNSEWWLGIADSLLVMFT